MPSSNLQSKPQMHKDIAIIILAAGQGTRMKSDTPKPLFKVSGKSMLSRVISQSRQISDDITVVVHHKADLIKQEISKELDSNLQDIKYHIQDVDKHSGTGGAIMGIGLNKKYTIVLNSDMPLIKAQQIAKLINKKSTITMSTLKLKSADGYGRVVIDSNTKNVVKIVEQKDASKDELKINIANAGVYCFESAFLNDNLNKLTNNNKSNEYYITDLVSIAIEQGLRVTPIKVSKKSFLGVNSKADLAKCEAISQKEIKKAHMLNGVYMQEPKSIYIDSDVVFEGECFVHNNSILLGKSVIKSSHIKPNTIIEDSIIDNSTIGPFARVRPNCNIKDSFIGNFVEAKNSTLNNIKAGHLSYLGDSTINSGTNIGAGCITCNYDGVNKHKTIIGKNVFVGSNSALVAPVVIEDDVLIGAGSTVTKDVPKGSLITTRVKKPTIIADYFYKFFKKS